MKNRCGVFVLLTSLIGGVVVSLWLKADASEKALEKNAGRPVKDQSMTKIWEKRPEDRMSSTEKN